MDQASESILISIKKMLGLEEDYTPFDTDVLVNINSALMTLTQLGIGPKEGFMINDYSETWRDFLTNDTKLGAVKNYVYLSVKILFDPPSSSFVLDAMKRQIEEIGWRLNVQAESVETFDFITDDAQARKRGWPGNDALDNAAGNSDVSVNRTKAYVKEAFKELKENLKDEFGVTITDTLDENGGIIRTIHAPVTVTVDDRTGTSQNGGDSE